MRSRFRVSLTKDLTHCILVDSSTVICLKSPFVILVCGAFTLFFYEKSC